MVGVRESGKLQLTWGSLPELMELQKAGAPGASRIADAIERKQNMPEASGTHRT